MSKHPSSDTSMLRSVGENLPTTSQVSSSLDSAKDQLKEEAGNQGIFSAERKLGLDAAKLVETTKEFIEEKNKDDIVQQMVVDASDAIDELTKMFQSVQFFQSRSQMVSFKIQAQDYAKFASSKLEALKNVAVLLINSPEFRGILLEFIELIQETFKAEVNNLPSILPSSTEKTEEKESNAFGMQAKTALSKAAQVYMVYKDVKEGNLPVPEDKKQDIFNRFKHLLTTISNNNKYKSAVDGIFALADQAQFYGMQIKAQATTEMADKQEFFYSQDSALWKFFTDLKTFVATFTSEEPLALFLDNLYDFFQLVTKDERLGNLFWDFREFITDVLTNPAILEEESFSERWNGLYERGNTLLTDPLYAHQWTQIWVNLRVCLDNIKNDTLQQRLADDASKLAKDLFLDTSGNPSIMVLANGLSNVKNLVVPIFEKNLKHFPVPGMSGTSDSLDWNIEGLYLNAKEILPDNIETRVWSKASVSLTDEPSKTVTYLTMWIKDMHLEAKALKFYFNRKVIPKIEEKGICDVSITGNNEIKITWKIEGEQDQSWNFSVEQVRCNLDNLDINIQESTHTWLMRFATTVFSGSIRREIEDAIVENIKEGLATINDKMSTTLKGISL